MSIGTSNQTAVYYTPEVTFGVTPATPLFTKVRITGETLKRDFKNIVSDEIRADRNRAESIRVGEGVAGDLNFELSIGSFNDVIQAVLGSTWSAPVTSLSSIKNGLVQRSFSLQKRVLDTTATFYENFVGCRFDALSLKFAPNEFLTGTIGVVGKTSSISAVIITGQTTAADVTTIPLNCAADITAITDSGVTSTEIYKSLTIDIKNNMRMLDAIGSTGPREINAGSFDVTGNLEIYFQNSTVYTRIINDTAFAMSITVTDDNGDYYKFTLPRIKLETAEITAGGLDQDMVVNCTYRAVYDTVTLATIAIEKLDV